MHLGNLKDYSSNALNNSQRFMRKIIVNQDFIYKVVFNVINMISYDESNESENNINDDLYLIRKQTLGNSHLSIIYLQNENIRFNPYLITSFVTCIFVTIFFINDDYIMVRLIENPNAKYKLRLNLLKFYEKDYIYNISTQLNQFMNLLICISNSLNFYMQKEDIKMRIKNDINIPNSLNTDKDVYNTNLTYRYNELEKIILKHKAN